MITCFMTTIERILQAAIHQVISNLFNVLRYSHNCCMSFKGGGSCGLPDDCVGVPNPDHGSGGGNANLSSLDRIMDGFHQDTHWRSNTSGWIPRT